MLNQNGMEQRMEFNETTMVERVIQWSNINSGSFNVLGLERLSAALTHTFSELECEGDVLSLPPIDQVNSQGISTKVDLGPMLRFWKRLQAPLQILLVGHMDTVFPLDQPFQQAKFKNDTIIVGPGVTDMKGGLCVMFEALKAFEKSKHKDKVGWEVLINPDEEIGSLASAPFLAERAKSHHLALLFEPAMDEQGTLAGERKGSGKFTLVVKGKAAHAGRDFHLGKNAICGLAELVLGIDQLNGQREGVTLNVGQIEGGVAVNVVPSLAIAKLDIRTQSVEDESWARTQIESIIKEVQKQREIKIDLMGQFGRKPKKLSGKTLALYELVQKISTSLGQPLSWKPSGGCCDGNNLSEAGLPNIDTLGVCGGKIHSDEEYLLVKSLTTRANLTYTLLTHLSEHGF